MRFISSIYVFVALLWVTYAAPVPVPQEKGSTENNTPIIHTGEVTPTENDAGGDLFNQFIEVIDLLSLDDEDLEMREKKDPTTGVYCVIA